MVAGSRHAARSCADVPAERICVADEAARALWVAGARVAEKSGARAGRAGGAGAAFRAEDRFASDAFDEIPRRGAVARTPCRAIRVGSCRRWNACGVAVAGGNAAR